MTSASDDSESGRTTQILGLFRRSSRSHLTSKSTHSLQSQTKSKASSGLRRLRRSSTSEKASDELNRTSDQAITTHTFRRASGLNTSNLPTPSSSQMLQQIVASSEASALSPRTKAITFEDQEKDAFTIPKTTSIPDHSSSLVDLYSTDKICDLSPLRPLSPKLSSNGDQPLSRVPSHRSSRTTDQCTTCQRFDHVRTVSKPNMDNLRSEEHENNRKASSEVETPFEIDDIDDTDGGSRPTKIIRLIAEVQDDGDSSSKDAFSGLLSMNFSHEDITYHSESFLMAVGSWVEDSDQPYLTAKDHRRVLKHIDEIEDYSEDTKGANSLQTSFLSLDSESTYRIRVGRFMERVGPLVSAWILFSIAVLRIEKLRLSLFVHTEMLRVGIDLNSRLDLDPDWLVEAAWFVDAASTMQNGSSSLTGKSNKVQAKVSSKLSGGIDMLDAVEGFGATKDVLKPELQRSSELSETLDELELHNTVKYLSERPTGEVVQPVHQDVLIQERQHRSEKSDISEDVVSPHTGPMIREPSLPVSQNLSNSKSTKSKRSREARVRTALNLEITNTSKQDDSLQSTSPVEELQLVFLTPHPINNRQIAGDFFARGRVFAIMWHEPVSSASSPPQKPRGKAKSITRTENGDWIYSHIRMFIIVTSRQGFSIAVPISSYGGKGLTKRKFTEAERKGHAIVHLEGNRPQLIQGEEPFTKEAIAVKPTPEARLNPASRINFRKPTTIEWHNRVANVGFVSSSSLASLTMYYNDEIRTTDAEV